MAIKLRFKNGWVIDHEQFLNDLYSDAGHKSKPFFEVLTPFRKDLEAEKVADVMQGEQRRIRKRKKKLTHCQSEQSNISKLLEVHSDLLSQHPAMFRPPW